MLAADAVIGVVMGLLVLAQADAAGPDSSTCVRRRRALDELATSLTALAAAVAARAAAAYVFATVGRHASGLSPAVESPY